MSSHDMLNVVKLLVMQLKDGYITEKEFKEELKLLGMDEQQVWYYVQKVKASLVRE